MALRLFTTTLAIAGLLAPSVYAEEATDMGAAAFLWPPDRAWGAAIDTTSPCGSSAGVTNRTEFPLTNGYLSLVFQDESYTLNVGVSYEDNPTTNDDFTSIISGATVSDIDPGHECYPVPNPPSNVTTGSNATFQLQYISDYDNDGNETYYACADITYITLADFDTNVLCFNVSEADTTSSSSSSSTSSTSSGSSSSNKSGLSGGDIAGIVVGTVAGAAMIGAALFFAGRWWQKRVSHEHAVQLNMMNQGDGVKKTWSASTAGRNQQV